MPSLISQLIVKFMGKTICRKGLHYLPLYYHCIKHNDVLCKLCRNNSALMKYCYPCNRCKQTMCILHYKQHLACNKLGQKFGQKANCMLNTIIFTEEMVTKHDKQNIIQMMTHLCSDQLNIKIENITTIGIIRDFLRVDKNLKELSIYIDRILRGSLIARNIQRNIRRLDEK